MVGEDDAVDTVVDQAHRVGNVLNALDDDLAGPQVADDGEILVTDRGVHRGIQQLADGAASG